MPDHLAAKSAEIAAPCPIDQALPDLFRQLDAWHQDFGAPLVLALSGGGDSMALCRIASLWANGTSGLIHAVSIDHGLRPSSASEAAQAIEWAKALGLSGEVIRLPERPAQGGLQEWARLARYQALA
ncbi:MAG: tRNA lysidine(34) synthetase TilS, partial [Pseudomonadota bacterium]